MEILPDLVDNKGQIWPGNCKIPKTTNKAAILSSLLGREKIWRYRAYLDWRRSRLPDEAEYTSMPRK
jgi:hypothetical protein